MEEPIHPLQQELSRLSSPVELVFHRKAGHELSEKLESYLHALCDGSGGRLQFAEEGETAEAAVAFRPSFTLKGRGRDNVHYGGIPRGNETAAFARLLSALSRGEAPAGRRAVKALERLSLDAELWVFVSPWCSRCPKVVEAAGALALVSPRVRTSVVDVEWFAEAAKAHGVESVPATLVDRELHLVGPVDGERLAELLAERGGPGYEKELLRSLIERGRASDAAARLTGEPARSALLALLEEPDFSTRLGALATLELARERHPFVIREMVHSLIRLLGSKDPRLRGDVADFLGRAGDARAIPELEKLQNDPSAEVVEAACEALERLRSRAR